MQAIWKGAISFGLVSIPVRVYSATDERGVSLRQVHAADGGRIRYRRVCEIDGDEVPYSDIAKGYELPGGELIVLDDADFDNLPLASTKAVDVVQFVPADQLDPIRTGRSYYLKPDTTGAKPYALLREALHRTRRVAIVKVALRSREHVAALRAYGDVLLMQVMLWPEEIRDTAGFGPEEDIRVGEQEVAMAESYIETLTGDFDPSAYVDEYKAALEAVVEAKIAGREVVEPGGRTEPAAEVVDLMEALRQSVARARQDRGETEEPDGRTGDPEEPDGRAGASEEPDGRAGASEEPDGRAGASEAARASKPARRRRTAERGSRESDGSRRRATDKQTSRTGGSGSAQAGKGTAKKKPTTSASSAKNAGGAGSPGGKATANKGSTASTSAKRAGGSESARGAKDTRTTTSSSSAKGSVSKSGSRRSA